MWAIIRKPIASMPCSRAQPMCCWQMSASVTWVAILATVAPWPAASSRSPMVPMPGSSSTASHAFGIAWRAASSSLAWGSSERPYCNEEPPSPSPWETSTVPTPARSSPPAIAATWSAVNWWALAWLPSRNVESITRTPRGSAIGDPLPRLEPLGDLLADPHRRRGHDVQVPGIGRQVVASALHLHEDGDLLVVEDRLPAQPVARHVGAHRRHHLVDRGGHRLLVHRAGQRVDRIPHHDRRLRRVQHDDRLGPLRPADPLDPPRGRLRELVDIRPRPGQPLGGRVDPRHHRKLQHPAAQQLDHQVGADIARPQDGHPHPLAHQSSSPSRLAESSKPTLPSRSISSRTWLPGRSATASVAPPAISRSPACSRSPAAPTRRAAATSERTG